MKNRASSRFFSVSSICKSISSLTMKCLGLWLKALCEVTSRIDFPSLCLPTHRRLLDIHLVHSFVFYSFIQHALNIHPVLVTLLISSNYKETKHRLPEDEHLQFSYKLKSHGEWLDAE